MYSDRMAVLKAVENLQFMGGGTNTGDALQYVTTNIYRKDGGARTDVSTGGLFSYSVQTCLPLQLFCVCTGKICFCYSLVVGQIW